MEERKSLEGRIRQLEEENHRLKARIKELESKLKK
jgi:cell division septum initiation protein DivIVA